MKRSYALAALALGSISTTATAEAPVENVAQLFQDTCVVCHQERGPVDDRIAPPMAGVKAHYAPVYKDRESFIAAVAAWVRDPRENAVLMPGAVRRFGLMPPLELEDGEAEAIAAFIYDADLTAPDWFEKHFEAEHGEPPSTE